MTITALCRCPADLWLGRLEEDIPWTINSTALGRPWSKDTATGGRSAFAGLRQDSTTSSRRWSRCRARKVVALAALLRPLRPRHPDPRLTTGTTMHPDQPIQRTLPQPPRRVVQAAIVATPDHLRAFRRLCDADRSHAPHHPDHDRRARRPEVPVMSTLDEVISTVLRAREDSPDALAAVATSLQRRDGPGTLARHRAFKARLARPALPWRRPSDSRHAARRARSPVPRGSLHRRSRPPRARRVWQYGEVRM